MTQKTAPPEGRARLQDLLQRVRTLELVAARNVASLLSGSYRTTFRGQGLDFHEARKYVAGEPVRRIDWRMTARMREAYVQVHHEERQREVFVAVDTSPSMATGWQQRNKLETAIEVAASLGLAAVRAGDRLGHVLFTDRVEAMAPPRAGRVSLFLLLRRLLETLDAASDPAPTSGGSLSDVRAAIHAIQDLRGKRFVVFLISDFVDADLGDDLHYLERRHDTTLVRIEDPLERVAPHAALRRLVRSPEGTARIGAVDDADAAAHGAHRATMDRHARRRRAHSIDVDTAADVGRALHRGLDRKRLRVRRAPVP